jgi:8-oxo-dGTP diphosphatase
MPRWFKAVVNRSANTAFLVGLAGVIRNERGEVLILHHTYRPDLPHGVPTGWLARGEVPGDALTREISEETGLDVEFIRVLRVDVGDNPPRLDIWLDFRFLGGEFRPSAEVSDARFFALDSLPPLLPAQREFLATLESPD